LSTSSRPPSRRGEGNPPFEARDGEERGGADESRHVELLKERGEQSRLSLSAAIRMQVVPPGAALEFCRFTQLTTNFSSRCFLRKEMPMTSSKIAVLFAVLVALAACGGHHGQILHQDRPGGTDYNAPK
jgi:hypothetical protein